MALNLIERFCDSTGKKIRITTHNGNFMFNAKDICENLGLSQYRSKTSKLDADEKMQLKTDCGEGFLRKMMFVTEAGLYSIILTCKGATLSGTVAHSFRRWVTHDILPAIRADGIYKLKKEMTENFLEEKSRRLWIVLKNMDMYTYRIRRKYFGRICTVCRSLCFIDEFNAPHVFSDKLKECTKVIREFVNKQILDEVPSDQTKLSRYFSTH